jgi:hypothetical protein
VAANVLIVAVDEMVDIVLKQAFTSPESITIFILHNFFLLAASRSFSSARQVAEETEKGLYDD